MQVIFYFVAVLIVIVIIIYVVALLVWLIQWIGACLFWFWQILVFPLFVYLIPILLVIALLCGFFGGTGVAMKNYVQALRDKVDPGDMLGRMLKNYIMTIMYVVLIAIIALVTYDSSMIIYKKGSDFANYVMNYYQAIKFPGYEIHFPFWEQVRNKIIISTFNP